MKNESPLDKWTLIHLAAGALMKEVGLSTAATVGVLTVFELLERPLFDTEPESLVNQVADVGAGWLGHSLWERLT